MGIEKTFNITAIGAFNPSAGGGSSASTTLLSITTAPSAPFSKGSKYYNSTTKKIYTAVADNTWTDAKESDPSFGAYYIFNNKTYTWDGNTLELFELEDYQKSSFKTNDYTNTSIENYPSSKALSDGLATKQDTLTAGTNITITDNVIAATDTTYTAGENVSISAENVISATDTTYTAGTGITIEGTTISATTSYPAQTDKAGKVLTTDGTNVSWQSSARVVTGATQNNVEFGQGAAELDWENLQIGDRLDNKATYVGMFAAEDPGQAAQNYAVFVLDAAYRPVDLLYSVTREQTVLPWYDSTTALTAKESSTYNTNQIKQTYNNDYACFNYAVAAGSVTVNSVTYTSVLPNALELQTILEHKVAIDAADPTSTTNPITALSNWENRTAWTSTFSNWGSLSNFALSDQGTLISPMGSSTQLAVIPVFEIPVPQPATRYSTINRVKVDGVLYQIQDKSLFTLNDAEATAPTLTLVDDTYYTFTNALTSLTINNIPAENTSGINILFTTAAGFTGVTFPAGTLYTGTIPTWEANKTYLISIQHEIAVMAEIKTME